MVSTSVMAFAMVTFARPPRRGLGIARRRDRPWRGVGWCGLRRGDRRLVGSVALDDLVEFAAVEPDAPALRAIVDLNPLPVGEDEVHPTYRAEQALRALRRWSGCGYYVCHDHVLVQSSAIADWRRMFNAWLRAQ
jgi:hypothetical protein